MRNHIALSIKILLASLFLVSCSTQLTPVMTFTSAPPPTMAPTVLSSPTPLQPTATLAPEPTPTPAPPTFTPMSMLPMVTQTPILTTERIRFAPGATEATIRGYLSKNGAKTLVLRVLAGQYISMDATLGATGKGLRFSIVGADGTVVKAVGDAQVRTVVPTTQDYYLELMSDVGAASYQMSVLIPVRIRFSPGATSTQIDDSLMAHGTRHYVLHALAGQRMIITPCTSQGQTRLIISGTDGQVLLSGRVGPPGGVFDGILPTTQDYLITVHAEGDNSAHYVMKIVVLPL